MKEIVLTNGSVTFVDDEDFDELRGFSWFCTNGYAMRWIPEQRKNVYLHREMMQEDLIGDLVVDHIDRNPLNNQRSNLRVVTKSEDLKNRAPFKRGVPMKILDRTQDRYAATPLLRQVIAEQGRRKTWMGEQIGVSNSQVSHVLAGRRTVVESDAQVWANILGVPFNALWKLAKASTMLAENENTEEAIPA